MLQNKRIQSELNYLADTSGAMKSSLEQIDSQAPSDSLDVWEIDQTAIGESF